MNVTDRNVRLRAALRGADPALDGRELSPAEVARMRRRVLDATRSVAPWHSATPVGGWLLVAAALALLALGLVMLRSSPAATVERQATRRTEGATLPHPPEPSVRTMQEPALTPGALAEAAIRPDPAQSPEHIAARGPLAPPGAPARAVPPAPAPVALAAKEPMPFQVQLTTPGGTRIVWVLEPAKGGR